MVMTNAEIVLQPLQGLTHSGTGPWSRYDFAATYPIVARAAPLTTDQSAQVSSLLTTLPTI
jgi:hypothetical protein